MWIINPKCTALGGRGWCISAGCPSQPRRAPTDSVHSGKVGKGTPSAPSTSNSGTIAPNGGTGALWNPDGSERSGGPRGSWRKQDAENKRGSPTRLGSSSLGTHEQVASWLLPEATESPCPEFYPTPPSAPPSGVMPLIPNVSGNPGRPRPNCWDPRTSYQRKDHQRLKFRTSSRAMRFSQKVQFYNYVHLYIFTLYI